MFWNTWNCIYQRFIFSYSKPFANFATISEVLMLWKDIFNERCYWDYLLFSNSRKIWKGMKMIAVAPHHLIYTYLISIRLLDIVKIGVGCYCFIHAKAMREAREKDKADIVPTPYFLSAFFGELGSISDKRYDIYYRLSHFNCHLEGSWRTVTT